MSAEGATIADVIQMAIIKCETQQILEDRLLRALQLAVDQSQGSVFAVGLSGGSLPALVSEVLPKVRTDWRKWRFFFCDERLVPFDDMDSTFGVYRKSLLTNFREISEKQFLTIDQNLPQNQVAEDYQRRMRLILGDRGLDLALLGIGPDGHTCSLFPGHPLLEESSQSIALITDSPKPPSSRITMTLAFLEKTESALFVALGESKAEVLKDILVDGQPLPAGRVNSKHVTWLLDSASARLIPETLICE